MARVARKSTNTRPVSRGRHSCSIAKPPQRAASVLERSITFVIIGFFVFVPGLSTWNDRTFVSWHIVYVPFLLLIAAGVYQHVTTKNNPPRTTDMIDT